MLVLPQIVQITCNPSNKKRLVSQGYNWEYMKLIDVNVLDLTLGSGIEVSFLCDYCLKDGIKTIRRRAYNNYNSSRKIVAKDCCNNEKCTQQKIEEVNMKKYGKKNAMQVKEINKKAADKRRMPFEEVKQIFNENNMILLEKEFINSTMNMKYLCVKHADKGEQDITLANLKNGHGCFWCGVERRTLEQTGSKSHLWKGGKVSLHSYLREHLKAWKKDSMESSNYKCIITGLNSDIEVHHLYSFNKILDETLAELNLPLYSQIGDYTDEELKLLEDKCLEIHYRYPLGVCLIKSLHDEFHLLYGKDNNTSDQFDEYMEKYHNKKISMYYANSNKTKYFPYKNNSSSKYTGITYVKSKEKWQTSIVYKRKSITIGRYPTEYEAAEAYNKKAVELFGENTTLNLLIESEKPNKPEEVSNIYKIKNGTMSKYFGVSFDKRYNRWRSRINFNGKRLHLGSFDTEDLAAIAFNEKSIELFGENAKLNDITI